MFGEESRKVLGDIMSQPRFKIIIASIIGNMLEWYDFALFGIFATLFAKHFFPTGHPKAALIGTFGIFAVGYLMRPIGGALIGHMGDQKSRRKALIIALLIMGTATTLIGLLPTYSSIGIWATILLVLLRMIQGLAVGGEFPGSLVILAEQAKPNLRAFTISLALVGAILGVLAGSGVANLLTWLLPKEAIETWGWRLPFLIGILLAFLGLYIRIKIWREGKTESIETVKIPFVQLIKSNKLNLLKAFCILSVGAVLTGIMSIFLVTYLIHYLNLPLEVAYRLLFMSSVIMLISFPLSAFIADYFNIHRQWLIIGLVLLILASYPLFLLMQQGSVACTIAVALLSALSYFVYGPFTPILIDLFPKQVRYSGVGIMHGLAFSIIAGTTPLFMNWLVLQLGKTAPSFYIIISALAALMAIYASKKKNVQKKSILSKS